MHVVHVCERLCGPEANIGVPSTVFHLIFWRISHRNYNLQISSIISTARPWDPSVCLSPVVRWKAHTATLDFLMWVLEGTLGLACAGSQLPSSIFFMFERKKLRYLDAKTHAQDSTGVYYRKRHQLGVRWGGSHQFSKVFRMVYQSWYPCLLSSTPVRVYCVQSARPNALEKTNRRASVLAF